MMQKQQTFWICRLPLNGVFNTMTAIYGKLGWRSFKSFEQCIFRLTIHISAGMCTFIK